MTVTIFQLAYVVADIDAAIAHWSKRMGVGPFFVLRHPAYDEQTYKGARTNPDVSLAFAYSGETNIELIQLHDDQPSVYRDFVEQHGHGLQHLGAMSDDIEADSQALLERGGLLLQKTLSAAGVETRFFDTGSPDGVLFELIARSPEVVTNFEYMKTAATAWDGLQAIAYDG